MSRIIACSCWPACNASHDVQVLKAGKEGSYASTGHGERIYDNWDRILFPCDGEDFKTVMAALKSNTERWGILDVCAPPFAVV